MPDPIRHLVIPGSDPESPIDFSFISRIPHNKNAPLITSHRPGLNGLRQLNRHLSVIPDPIRHLVIPGSGSESPIDFSFISMIPHNKNAPLITSHRPWSQWTSTTQQTSFRHAGPDPASQPGFSFFHPPESHTGNASAHHTIGSGYQWPSPAHPLTKPLW